MARNNQEQTELEHLRTILRNTREGIVVIQDGLIRYCNQRVVDLTGYSEEELVSSEVAPFLHPDDRHLVPDRGASRSSDRGRPDRAEVRIGTKSGGHVRADVSGTSIEWNGAPATLAVLSGVCAAPNDGPRPARSGDPYEGVLSSIPIGIFRSTPEGKYRFVNDSFAAMLGYDKQELLREEFRIHGLYADPAARREVARKLARDGELYNHSIQLRRKDGRLMWMAIFVRQIADERGTCYEGFALDVTNEKLLARERDHLKDRLQALWNIAKLADVSKEEINSLILEEIVRSTQSAYSFFGVVDEADESIIRHSWSEKASQDCAINPRPLHAIASEAGIWARPASDGRVLMVNDYRNHPGAKGCPKDHLPLKRILSVPILRDGNVIAVATAANKKTDYTDEDARQIEAFVSSALLLLDKKEQETNLVESESKFRALFDNAGEGIFLADGDSAITDANHAAAAILGYDRPEDLVGMNALDLLHPEDMRERSARDNIDKAESEEAVRLERRYRRKDGSYVPVQVTIKYIGTSGLHHVLFSDISERKNFEEALKTKIVALTKPSGDLPDITFDVLFDVDEIQKIQDEFAAATGVASIITTPEGKPITKPSNFTRFCRDIVRSSPLGLDNCRRSDATIGVGGLEGPRVQRCLSGGLWDAGASIDVGGRHIANWLVGQVRDESCDEESILDYAQRIDVDGDELLAAFRAVPVMPERRFRLVAEVLHSFARQLSLLAYQNVQQARLIEDKNRAEEKNRLLADLLNTSDSIAVYKDPSLGYLMVNAEFLSLTGYESYLDVLGKRDEDVFKDIASPEEIAAFVENDRKALALPRGEVLTVEESVMGEDGSARVFLTKKFPIYQEGRAAPSGVATLTTEITGLKRTQEELLSYHARLTEKQETLRLVMHMAAIAPWELDLRSGTFTFNDEFYDLYATDAEREGGYRMPAEQYSRVFVQPLEGNLVESAIAGILAAKERDYSRQLEHRIVRRDGQIRHIIVRFLLIRDERGKPVKVIGANQDITEQKALVHRLDEREKAYKALVNGMPDVIMRFDRECRHLFVSDSAERYVSVPAPDFLGKTHADLGFPAEDCAYWEDAIREVFDSGQEFEDEFTISHQGREIVFNWRLIPEFIESGEVASVLSISRDITSHRRLEQDFKNLFERMLDGFAVHEILCDDAGKAVDYRFLAVNQAFEEMVGLRREDVVGRTVMELMPETEPYWIETYGKVAFTGEPVYFENYSKEVDRYFEVTAYRPAPNQFACIFADVTERKRALDNFERIFDLSLDLICVCDLEDIRFLRVSSAFNERLGYSEEELIGRTLFDFLHPDDFAPTEAVIADKLRKGLNVLGFENRLRAKSGHHPWISWYVRPVPEEGVLYAVGRDISGKKQYEDELIQSKEAAEAASKAKSEFLANMSHEIRTPLNGMLGMLQLIERSELSPDHADYINKALFSGERLTRLLTDILDVSAIEARKLALSHADVRLSDLVESVASLLATTAQHKGLELRTEVSPDTPDTVISDEVRLRQILFNLAGNGLKFTQSGFVSIHAGYLPGPHSGRGHVLLTIADTGSGIADDHLDKAFETFGQIAQGYTKEHQGAGLGLPIVKRIVDLMGGGICVDSRIGRGSTFYVSSPVEVRGEARSGRARRDETAPDSGPRRDRKGGMTILLVEDEPSNAFALTRLLGREGHDVEAAANGQEALDALRRRRFDLVLMDIQMPVMNGIEATRAIRSGAAGEGNRAIPVIAMTAYAMEGDREKFLAEGLDDYIEKPVRFDRMLELLDRTAGG